MFYALNCTCACIGMVCFYGLKWCTREMQTCLDFTTAGMSSLLAPCCNKDISLKCFPQRMCRHRIQEESDFLPKDETIFLVLQQQKDS